jgi:CIC family chloride channel protein
MGIFGALGLSSVMGNGYGYMDHVIEVGGEPVIFLLVVLVGKMIATAACASSGAGTGTYSPSLFVGAVTGVLFGEIAHFLFPTIAGPAGAYGMVGMGAVAAAVTQAPITISLMLFEATRNYQIILPLLLTLAVSGVVSSILERGSLYVKQLEQRGVKLDRSREELVMYDLKVDDVMRRGQHTTVLPEAPFRVLADRFLASRRDEVYVVDAQERLVGFIDIQDIKRLLADPSAAGKTGDLARSDVPTVQGQQPLADTLPLFYRSGLEALPGVDDENRLLGVITERDVVGAYNREVLRKDVLLARIESGPPEDRTTDFFVLPDGHVMERIDVGPELIGRSLRDLQLQTRYGLTVMAVDQHQQDGGVRRCGARADLVLGKGDTLVVVGTEPAVKALQDGAPPPGEASA